MKKTSIVPMTSNQLMVVLTDSLKAVTGFMNCYERVANTNHWIPVGQKIPVMIGRNGLGNGIGLHPATDLISLPLKVEGDGRSPAGAYTLSHVFGYASGDTVSGLKMPYIFVTEMTECVDDIKSNQYNRIVSKDTMVKPESIDWNSSEKMNAAGVAYELGVVVNHNQNPVKKGCGSCIFLHIWPDSSKTTSGCTSMDASDMKKIAYWLDQQKYPVLVQLTKNSYLELKSKWKLPEIIF